ncbi:MAG: aldehyde ferredoxin oxidoreductase N-terminal domain-containing protein, partial [Fusobacteriaceae bacterium]
MATTYRGKVLRINLSTGNISTEKLDISCAKKFIGGRGLGTKMLMDEIDPKIDALSEDNKLFFVTGPATGTKISTGGRFMVVTKSPLNGLVACSNSGGVWGAKLKYAGYDVMIIEGKSATPKYINIEDDKVEICDAKSIWGMDTSKVEKSLKEKHKDGSVLNIGPAGESLSLMSAIMNDTDRAAGRSGVGAVMGSKNLKAIVVTTKEQNIDAPNVEAYKQLSAVLAKRLKENGVTGTGLPTYGTAVLVNILNSLGSYPTRNWQSSS